MAAGTHRRPPKDPPPRWIRRAGAAVLVAGAVLAPNVGDAASAAEPEAPKLISTGVHPTVPCRDGGAGVQTPAARYACRAVLGAKQRATADFDVAVRRPAGSVVEVQMAAKVRAGMVGVEWEGAVSIPPRDPLVPKVRPTTRPKPAPAFPRPPAPPVAVPVPAPIPARAPAAPEPPEPPEPPEQPEPEPDVPLLGRPLADGPQRSAARTAALVAVLGVFVMTVSMSAFSGALRNR